MRRGYQGYRPIRDYAILGDGHTAALVATNGSIDWCCWPRFDSPATFCRLLDFRKGGWFQIVPAGEYRTVRQYTRDTNVLETTFAADGRTFRLTDFMPIEHRPARQTGKDLDPSYRILRCIEGLSGVSEIEVGIRPTFDFAAAPAFIALRDQGLVARNGNQVVSLAAPGRFHLEDDGAAYATLRVQPGERVWVALVYQGEHEAAVEAASQGERDLERTTRFWQKWSSRCTYAGPHAELVRRSALALKVLIYSPTGALVAAPTTSLPEALGGIRNWDYRYTWLRDSTLTVDALADVGYSDEALNFFEWLEELDLHNRGDLQLMYTITGESAIAERELNHLEGYRGSRPVRVGNAASKHVQLDLYGEVLGVAHVCFKRMNKQVRRETWKMLRSIATQAAQRWRRSDRSIWEMRGEPQQFLYSKLRCWVAVDRAIRLAEDMQLPGETDVWHKSRNEIREAILTQGFNAEVGAFTQAFGSKELDASALTIPHLGFLPAEDPRVRSTMEKIRERLSDHGLVRRYTAGDGLPGGEGAFTLCTFWMIDNLAFAGRLDEAHQLFEAVAHYAGDAGLLSEEIDPASGDLLGNYPQGLAHLGLIRSATILASASSGRTRKADGSGE